MRRGGAKSSVYQITGARKPLTEDVRGRQRRYIISMSIRTVCFVLAIVLPSPWRWIMIAAAVVLPYVAVVFANAGRERPPAAPETMISRDRPELEPVRRPRDQ
ncbi:MAG: DUF3099 domain-containing protein [Carbonactinosporaceae bacterium]